MRRRLPTALLIAGILILSACDGGDDRAATLPPEEAAEPTTQSRAPQSAQRTEAELRAALLTVTDLPAGFTVDTSPDSASTPSGCEELDALEKQGGSELEARFTKGSYGPFVSETLKQGPSEAATHDALVKMSGALSQCRTFSTKADEREHDWLQRNSVRGTLVIPSVIPPDATRRDRSALAGRPT